jgi:RNA polymerase sigma factor (sigma-70 family)
MTKPPAEAASANQLGVLFDREAEGLWRAVYAFARDHDIASDAVAEAFAQCLRGGTAVRNQRAWVWRVAFRIAAGELKSRGRWVPLPADITQEIPEPSLRIVNAVGALSPHQRAAVLLRHYAGYSTREVAELLGIGASTARVHLSRGQRRLRSLLEDDDDG